jgi:hypothetical protein
VGGAVTLRVQHGRALDVDAFARALKTDAAEAFLARCPPATAITIGVLPAAPGEPPTAAGAGEPGTHGGSVTTTVVLGAAVCCRSGERDEQLLDELQRTIAARVLTDPPAGLQAFGVTTTAVSNRVLLQLLLRSQGRLVTRSSAARCVVPGGSIALG